STTERTPNNSSSVQVRILTKNDGYQWFENTSWRIDEPSASKIYGAIVNIHLYKLAELESEYKNMLFSEADKIAKLALWEIDVHTMQLSLSGEGYDIFELSNQLKLTASEMAGFFEPPGRA